MQKAIIGKKIGMTQFFDERDHDSRNCYRSRPLRGNSQKQLKTTATLQFSSAMAI